MTQADVARVLEEHQGLKLHATAIAKMEQRDASRPRVIRLSEAQAVAAVFGLTVDEMTSDAVVEMDALAQEFEVLQKQSEALRSQTGSLFARTREYVPLLATQEDDVTPALQASRNRIVHALAELQRAEDQRFAKATSLLDEVAAEQQRHLAPVTSSAPADLDDLQAQRRESRFAYWYRVAHRLYGIAMVDVVYAVQEFGNEMNLKVLARLSPVDGLVMSWTVVAVFSHGLWGHSTNEEFELRFIDKMKGRVRNAEGVKAEIILEMAAEIQGELASRASELADARTGLEEAYGDPRLLAAWSQAAIAETEE